MKIMLINPNSTASMTQKAACAASKVARPETEIVAVTSKNGPTSIEGFLDVAMCQSALVEEAANHKDVDAVIVGCFDDTGLDALRCVFDVPVVGIGEAAYHAASLVSHRFSVVTTLSCSVAGISNNLNNYGLATRCANVRTTDLPVLKLEENDPESLDLIRLEIKAALDEDKAEAIILGCAGMADLMTLLSNEFKVPVIDGVACAVGFVEALVAAGMKTSKTGTYVPNSGKYTGIT